MNTLIIDNYDSFTFNLFQLVGEITRKRPRVIPNDKFSWKEFVSWNIDNVIISPGPGRPDNTKDFGMSAEIIQKATIPILGICLGHQGIGMLAGAKIVQAPEILHGRKSTIFHNKKGLFAKIPQGFSAVRYHSFVVEKDSLPRDMEITAWTEDRTVMGIQHTTRPVCGVQFHPESIGTEYGDRLIKNFLKVI